MWEILANFFLNKLPDFLQRLWEKPKIKIEVKRFNYSLLENKPGDSILVLSPHPSSYYLELSLSNLGRRKTTIVKIRALINNQIELVPSDFRPIPLGPGECFKEVIIFPVEEQKAISQGPFELKVFEVFGKIFRFKGEFPIKN